MKQFGIDKDGAECKDIRPHLKAIDPLFEIVFDFDQERYLVYFNGGLLESVPWRDMGRGMLDRLRYVYWLNNNKDPFAEVDKANEKADRTKEKQRDDLIREMSKDLHKAVLKESY